MAQVLEEVAQNLESLDPDALALRGQQFADNPARHTHVNLNKRTTNAGHRHTENYSGTIQHLVNTWSLKLKVTVN